MIDANRHHLPIQGARRPADRLLDILRALAGDEQFVRIKVAELAATARFSHRQTQMMLGQLLDRGSLRAVSGHKGGRGRPRTYWIADYQSVVRQLDPLQGLLPLVSESDHDQFAPQALPEVSVSGPDPVEGREAYREMSAKFDLFLQTQGYAPDSIRTYVSNVQFLFDWCEREEVEAVEASDEDIRFFLSDQLRRVKPATAKARLMAARRFFDFYHREHGRADNPTAGLRVRAEDPVIQEPFTAEEIIALVTGASGRDQLILALLLSTGLRISEALNLEAGDINWQTGEAKVRGKGGKARRAWLMPLIRKGLQKMLNENDGILWATHFGTRWTRHSCQVQLGKVAVRLGVRGFHPHRCRTTFSCHFLGKSDNLGALQQLLGHSKIETTIRYAKYVIESRSLELAKENNPVAALFEAIGAVPADNLVPFQLDYCR